MSALLALLCLLIQAQETHSTTFKKIQIAAPPLTTEANGIGFQLNSNYKNAVDDSFLEVANLNFAGGTNRPRYLQVRGQGETSVYETTPNHSLSSWIDDIDVTGLVVSWPQLNIAQTELQKTSQTILSGSSSIAGQLQMNLHSPNDRQSFTSIYESQNAYQIGFEKNITQTSRLFFYRIDDPSFFKNSYLGTAGAARDEYYVSLKNEFLRTQRWTISSTHIGLHATNGYDVWSLRRPNQNDDFTTLSDHPGSDDLSLQGHSLRTHYKWNETHELIAVSSYTLSQSDYSYDADWGNNTYWNNIPGWNQNYDYVEGFGRQRQVWHQKFILSSAQTQTGLHLYGLHEDADILDFKNKILRDNLQSKYSSQHLAAFHQHHIPITESLTWSLGGRIESQNTRYQSTSVSTIKDQVALWAVESRWDYQISPQTQSHLLVSRGFKGAGVNIDPNSLDRFYGPEHSITYEVGASMGHDQGSVDGTLFVIDQMDKQLKISRQEDPLDPNSFVYETRNAGRARSLGAELSASHRWGRLRGVAQVGLLRAQLRDYVFENQQLRGRDLAHAPRWNYAMTVAYEWSKAVSSNISWVARDDFAFSNNHDQRSEALQLVNVGLTYQKQNWRMSAWLRNIFDERYATRGFFFANEPPNWQNKLYTQFGPPRHGGASFTYTF